MRSVVGQQHQPPQQFSIPDIIGDTFSSLCRNAVHHPRYIQHHAPFPSMLVAFADLRHKMAYLLQETSAANILRRSANALFC